MRTIYYHIIDYNTIHPIRFWLLTLFAITALIITSYLLTKRYAGKKSPLGHIFTQSKAILIVGFLLLSLVVGVLINKNYKGGVVHENISISSSKYVFGIDVSHYQGKINWSKMKISHHPIEFVFIRATMGVNGQDIYYKRNWENAKAHNYIRGAYHYYRPNENSTKQFKNFANQVTLLKGDFIPILDIEKESRNGKIKLREGVLNWLKLAEEKYGVKPMIYTGRTFYIDNLKGYVEDYPLWIAAYAGKHRLKGIDWSFHQFTEKVRVKGIGSTVDGNDFIGSVADLKKLCK